MTERLATLLREGAQTLVVPTPPAQDVLAEGHRLRRRRGIVSGIAVASVIGIATAGAVVVGDRLGSDGGGDPAPAAAYGQDGVFSVGRTVHLGGTDAPTVALDEDIHSLHYTSEGVLIRTNLQGGASDGSGPEHFTLVRSDGSTSEVSVTTEDIVVSTDLDQPYMAYSETDGDGNVQVVLRNVATDEEAARVDVPGVYEPAGWPSPPVWLDDETVYMAFHDRTLAIDWRTGESQTAEHLDPGLPEVYGGRTTTYQQVTEPRKDGTGGVGRVAVIDAESGEVLLTAETGGYGRFDLSPDGRFAILELESDNPDKPWLPPDSFEVYDVDTGTRVTVDRTPIDFGWTSEGAPFRLEGDELVICDPTTGACATQPSGVDADDVLAPGEPMQGGVTFCDENGKCTEEEPSGPQPLPVRVAGMLYEN